MEFIHISYLLVVFPVGEGVGGMATEVVPGCIIVFGSIAVSITIVVCVGITIVFTATK